LIITKREAKERFSGFVASLFFISLSTTFLTRQILIFVNQTVSYNKKAQKLNSAPLK
jgi:hypothetical protein